MEDIRLKNAEYTLDGKTYTIACNLNVLADVQEAYDGDLIRALDSAKGLRATLEFLAAMLRDAADSRGETGEVRRITAKELGRRLTLQETIEAGEIIFPLILDAIPHEKEDTEKN